MRAARVLAVLAVAALGLSACNNQNRGRGGADLKGICTPFAEMPTSAAAPGLPLTTDPAAAVDDCLHRWGYSLAAASDAAEIVAQATLAACTPALSRWNQQSLSPGGQPGGGGAERAPSLMTGQPTTTFQEHYAYAQGRALFYVVQARAGKCAPPPPPAGSAQR